MLLHNLGRLTEAATYYRRALADPTAAPETRATAANNLALVEMVHGRVAEAFAALDEAQRAAGGRRPGAGRPGDPDLGLGLRCRPAGSARAWRGSTGRPALRGAGMPLAEHYLEYVDALVDLRLLPEALATSRAAVAELDGSDVVLMAAEARLRLARLALLSDDAGPRRRGGLRRGPDVPGPAPAGLGGPGRRPGRPGPRRGRRRSRRRT